MLFFLFAIQQSCFGQNYFEEGYKEYFYGDLNKSVDLFSKAIQNNQELAKSYMYRGAAKGFLKEFQASIDDLDKSKTIDSTGSLIYFYYAKIYVLEGNYKLALDFCNKAIGENINDAASYDLRAAAKIGIKDFSGAIIDADVAIKLDSTKNVYYTNRGFAKSELRQFAEAIHDFDVSLKIAPSHKAYVNRGLANSKLGNHEKAIGDFSKALTIFPQDYVVFYNRGISYVAIGKIKEACTDFSNSKALGYAPASGELSKYNCH